MKQHDILCIQNTGRNTSVSKRQDLIQTSLPTDLSLIYPQARFSCKACFSSTQEHVFFPSRGCSLIISYFFLLSFNMYFWGIISKDSHSVHMYFLPHLMFSPIWIIISCEWNEQLSNYYKIKLLFPGQITLCSFLTWQIRSCHSLITEATSTDTHCPHEVGTINSSIK